MKGKISRLFHDRWQAPLILLATAITVVAVQRLKPPPVQTGFAELKARIEELCAAGELEAAANSAGNLLQQSNLKSEERATLHLLLADLLGRALRQPGGNSPENVKRLLTQMEAALASNADLSAQQIQVYAQALGLAGRRHDSANWYRRLVEKTPDSEMGRAARSALARLLIEHPEPESAAEARKLVAQILHDEAAPLDDRWWALQQGMQAAIAAQDWSRGHELLTTHREHFSTSDVQEHFDYLEALLLVEQGRSIEAVPLIESVEARLRRNPHSSRQGEFGHLPALVRLLRGRLHLLDEQPQAALNAFVEAQALDPLGVALPALLGRAQALAALEQHEDAMAAVDQAERHIATKASTAAGLAKLGDVLESLHSLTAAHGSPLQALKYLHRAAALPCEKERRLRLLERLGESELAVAATVALEQQQAHYAAAGHAWADAAQLAAAGSEHQASLLWNAAQQFDVAGRTADLRKMLHELLALGSSDPRRPAALLQLGQCFESVGAYERAIEQYDRLASEYPRLEEAARGQLRKADCLLSLGEERFAEAERTLGGLLESETVSPQAAAFHDALLNLADLLYQQRRYADAIGRLENFLERYPGDDEEARAQFLLADAYRLSAYELSAPPSDQSDPHRTQEGRTRFRDAVQRYRSVREAFLAEPKDEPQRLYRLLSLMAEADCLAELNEPETLVTAVARYTQVVAENERTPTALVAQVQLARLHLRQDSVVDAARAVERCRWLMQGISDEAFASSLDGLTRLDWERYFSTIAASPLFQNAFSSSE